MNGVGRSFDNRVEVAMYLRKRSLDLVDRRSGCRAQMDGFESAEQSIGPSRHLFGSNPL
jgi:hypothetical protein